MSYNSFPIPSDISQYDGFDDIEARIEALEEGGGGGYPEPTGEISITKDGDYDVKDVATAKVKTGNGTFHVVQNGVYSTKSGIGDYTYVEYFEVDVPGSGSYWSVESDITPSSDDAATGYIELSDVISDFRQVEHIKIEIVSGHNLLNDNSPLVWEGLSSYFIARFPGFENLGYVTTLKGGVGNAGRSYRYGQSYIAPSNAADNSCVAIYNGNPIRAAIASETSSGFVVGATYHVSIKYREVE